MKIDRKVVYGMFGGRCAYCGCELENESGKYMHIDHMEAVYRDKWKNDKMYYPENHNEENLIPACPSCNIYKSVFGVESLRKELNQITERLKRFTIYKIALRFGMIEVKEWDGVFWFEKYSTFKEKKR